MDKRNVLFNEYKLNSVLTLKNRIVMAPMTRAKAEVDLQPTQEMLEYYARRADAGLIVTEGTVISRDALGYNRIPGIFTEKQIWHWKRIMDAVHANQGKIFMQLWHVGRVSHPEFIKGNLPISASATRMSGKVNRRSDLTYGWSRPATLSEIQELIVTYATAAKNAIQAGADGIEIHGANGYLIDQFLHHHTNKRDDEYGGTPENMARFALEVVKACGEAIGFERVGLRLSPGAYMSEMVGDVRDGKVFQYLLTQLNAYPIAYVHTGNFDDKQLFEELQNMTMTAFIRLHYQGTLIASGGYTAQLAEDKIAQREFDLVAMGRPFIANPDLINRLSTNAKLVSYDPSMLNTLY